MKKFTLIELLIVIAIMGILFSLLLPSLSKAKENAKTAVCMSKFREKGKGITLYTADNNGRLPGGLWRQQRAKYKHNRGTLGSFIYIYLHPNAPDPRLWKMWDWAVCPTYDGPNKNSIHLYVSAGTHANKWDCTNSQDSYYRGWYFRGRSRKSCFAAEVEEPSSENAFMEVDDLYNPFNSNVRPTPAHGFKGGAGVRNKLNFDGSVFSSTTLLED